MAKLTGESIVKVLDTLFEDYYSSQCIDEMSSSKKQSLDNLYEFTGEEEDLEKAETLYKSLGEMENVQRVETVSGDAFFILHVKESDVHIKVQGYWNSYENFSEYEDASFSVVKPKTVETVVYT